MKPFFDWRPLFVALLSAATTLIVLSATSCSTSKRVEQSVQMQQAAVAAHADSLQSAATFQQTTLLTHQAVKADSLSMAIPLTSLRELPPGASYAQRKGRAHLSLRSRGDTLFVDAGCDSLQRLVTYYADLAATYQHQAARGALLSQRSSQSHKREVKKPPNHWPALFVGLALIVATATLIYHRKHK